MESFVFRIEELYLLILFLWVHPVEMLVVDIHVRLPLIQFSGQISNRIRYHLIFVRNQLDLLINMFQYKIPYSQVLLS